jgi:type I restriction enzyme S subunit
MNWAIPRLAEIADIVGGSTPRRNRDEFWGGDILWLTPTDLPAPGSGVVDVTETAAYMPAHKLVEMAYFA